MMVNARPQVAKAPVIVLMTAARRRVVAKHDSVIVIWIEIGN